MAYVAELSNVESKAFDYADTYAAMGYETNVILDVHGAPCLISSPRLIPCYEIAVLLPEHEAPELTM